MKALISTSLIMCAYSEFNLLDSWKGAFSTALKAMWMHLSFLPNWILMSIKLDIHLVFF